MIRLKEKNYLKNENKLLYLQKNKNSRIGIMGGTFDPIHNGHLAMAEYIREEYQLDKVLFIPTGNPPHKRKEITNKLHRYDMCVLATKSNEDFVVSDIEIKREKSTYTIDTLRELKDIYPNSKLYFITGADAICDIESWKDVSETFKLATFIATTRPGISKIESNAKIDELINKYDAEILKVYAPLIDISSTYVRNRVVSHRSIKYIVPDDVEEYINENKLYDNV